MRQLLTILSITTLLFTACAQQKMVAGDTGKKYEGKIEKIAMARTPCFGRCPAYRIDIMQNGTAVYTSHSSTEYEGTYTKQFNAGKVADLFRKFDKYKVDTCSKEYPNQIPDVPGLNLYIYYKGKEEPKEIYNAHFGPDFLKDLAIETDSFAQVNANWKKISDDKEQ